MSEAIVTALTGVSTSVTSALSSVAPIAIVIMGTFLAWKLGIKFFKSLAK